MMCLKSWMQKCNDERIDRIHRIRWQHAASASAFEALYRSTNIGEIENKAFDIVVCAGAQAQKWIANREPEGDLQNIHRLMARLRTVRCRKFILISTADVFKSPL